MSLSDENIYFPEVLSFSDIIISFTSDSWERNKVLVNNYNRFQDIISLGEIINLRKNFKDIKL